MNVLFLHALFLRVLPVVSLQLNVHLIPKKLLHRFPGYAVPMCHVSIRQLVKLMKSLTMLEIKYLMRILVSIGEWSLLSRLFTKSLYIYRVLMVKLTVHFSKIKIVLV